MVHALPQLPYSSDALAPFITPETISYHWGKHHKAYVDNLNKLIPGTEFENLSLEDIVRKSSGPIFNNAAQIWNHTFYWKCLTPNKNQEPTGKLLEFINRDFGSISAFKEKMTETAIKTFGSGWAWLVQTKTGQLQLMSTSNAGCPLTEGHTPLLTCDVWEHAYYIDHRNDRAKYVAAFFNHVDWSFVASNLK